MNDKTYVPVSEAELIQLRRDRTRLVEVAEHFVSVLEQLKLNGTWTECGECEKARKLLRELDSPEKKQHD